MTQAGRIRAYVLENPAARPREVSEVLGIPLSSVQNAMARDRRRTRHKLEKIFKRPEAPPPAAALPTEEDLDALILAALDPEQRMRAIAELAAKGKDEVKLRALAIIHELQTQSGAVSSLPPPTNEDEQAERLARMMRSVSPEILAKAQILAAATEAAPSELEAPEELPSDVTQPT